MRVPASRRFFVQHLSTAVVPGSERTVNDWLSRSGFELGGTSNQLCGGARLRDEFKGLVLDVDGSAGKLTIRVDGTRELDLAAGKVEVGEKGDKDLFSIQMAGSGPVQLFRLRCKEVSTNPDVPVGGSTPPLDDGVMSEFLARSRLRDSVSKRQKKKVGRRKSAFGGNGSNGTPNPAGVGEDKKGGEGDLPKVPTAEPSLGTIVSIPVDRIRPNPEQPRKEFREARLQALGKSLKQDGQRIPAQVIRVSGDPNADFELVMGERRWRAAKLVGLTHLKAVVLSNEEVPGRRKQHRLCMVMDFNQEGYSPLEIALALLEERQAGASVEELCSICGRSVAWVYQHLALNELDEKFRQMLLLPKRQRMPFGIACRLAKFPKERQSQVWDVVSKEKGSRLQLIRIQSLGTEEDRPGAKGRPRKPSDYAANLAQHIIPRLAGDALTASRYPEGGFDSLVQHSGSELVGALSRNLDTAIEGLNDLRRKFDEALKRKG
jgi:ParB family chromosome partitioning protein